MPHMSTTNAQSIYALAPKNTIFSREGPLPTHIDYFPKTFDDNSPWSILAYTTTTTHNIDPTDVIYTPLHQTVLMPNSLSKNNNTTFNTTTTNIDHTDYTAMDYNEDYDPYTTNQTHDRNASDNFPGCIADLASPISIQKNPAESLRDSDDMMLDEPTLTLLDMPKPNTDDMATEDIITASLQDSLPMYLSQQPASCSSSLSFSDSLLLQTSQSDSAAENMLMSARYNEEENHQLSVTSPAIHKEASYSSSSPSFSSSASSSHPSTRTVLHDILGDDYENEPDIPVHYQLQSNTMDTDDYQEDETTHIARGFKAHTTSLKDTFQQTVVFDTSSLYPRYLASMDTLTENLLIYDDHIYTIDNMTTTENSASQTNSLFTEELLQDNVHNVNIFLNNESDEEITMNKECMPDIDTNSVNKRNEVFHKALWHFVTNATVSRLNRQICPQTRRFWQPAGTNLSRKASISTFLGTNLSLKLAFFIHSGTNLSPLSLAVLLLPMSSQQRRQSYFSNPAI